MECLCIYPMNQQSCFTGIPAGVFNTKGKNLNVYQYWVSQSRSNKRTECLLMVTLKIQQERCGARMGKGHLHSIHHIINNNHVKTGVWCDFPCVLGLPKPATQTNKQTKKPTQNATDYGTCLFLHLFPRSPFLLGFSFT